MTSIVDLQQPVIDDMTGAESLVISDIVDDLGEVQFEGFVKPVEKTHCKFRTPLDLKMYDDREVSTQPSKVDTSGYIDTRIVIDKIMRNTPIDVLKLYGDQFSKGDYSSDEADIDSDDYDEFADHLDEFDYASEVSEVTEAIAEAPSKNQPTSNSAVSAEEGAQATDDKQTAD